MSVNRSAPGLILALLGALSSACRAADSDRAATDTAAVSGNSAPVDSVRSQPLPAAARAWVDSLRAPEQPRLRTAGTAAARPSWDRLVLTAR
jgi:hypothetical protein